MERLASLIRRPSASGYFLLGNILMGLNVPLAKFAMLGVALGPFLIVRHVVAGLFLMVIAKRTGEWRQLDGRQWRGLLRLGLVGIGLANFLLFLAVTMVPSTHVLLVTLTMPVMVYLLSVLMLGDRLGRQAVVGAIVSLTGVILLVSGQYWYVHGSASVDGVGLAVLILAVLVTAFSVVDAKRLLSGVAPLQVASMQLLIGSIPFVIWWGPELISYDWSNVASSFLWVFALTVLVVTPLSFWAFYKGLKSVALGGSVGYIYFQTLAGDLLAVSLFGERLTQLYIASMVVVVLGVWLGRAHFSRTWEKYLHPDWWGRVRHLGALAFRWHR